MGSPQIETCDLCGLAVEHASLREVNVEGLRGRAVCDKHPWEAKVRSRPGYQDQRRISGRRQASVPRRLPPYGSSDVDFGATPAGDE